jgi:hypothetical protein
MVPYIFTSFHTQAVYKILNKQNSMSLYGYVYFKWNDLRSTLSTSVCCYAVQDTRTYYSVSALILEILLYFMFYTYWLTYDLSDSDLRKTETCWRYNVLIVKLHTTIVQSVIIS